MEHDYAPHLKHYTVIAAFPHFGYHVARRSDNVPIALSHDVAMAINFAEELDIQARAAELEERAKSPTYSLLVSNVGYVHRDNPDEEEVRKDYKEYVESTCYSSVSLWSSDRDDPIEVFEIEKEYPEGYPERREAK